MQEPPSQEKPQVRYRPIDRSRLSSASLDVQLPAGHPVRLLWQFACSIDLSAFARPTKATVDAPGAPVISPEGVHARQSNGGFKKIRLRGQDKARAEVLWQALAHNLGVLISRGLEGRGAVRAR